MTRPARASRSASPIRRTFLVAAALAAAGLSATNLLAQAAPPERLHVLFLGDHGHHEPSARADELYAPLARAGIAMDFTFECADLRPDVLSRYDALVIYANHDLIEPEQEKALLDFVEGGRGLVALHCASFCFRNSAKYVALVGGVFDHHSMGEFTAHTVAPDHPALRGVEEFATTDETYVHRELAADRTVLQTRDENGKPEPYTWVRTQGKGRVYYTALGHDERTFTQPAFHAQVIQAIRWAADREDFEWTPPKLTTIDVNLPNYRPDLKWGQTAEPIRNLQGPLSAEDELQLLQVPAGFEARLAASEPDILKPIAFSFDRRGRPWIAEALDYPNSQQPPGQGHDDIKILSEADEDEAGHPRGDGRSHVVGVFADKLSLVTSLVCVPGGCIVAQMPDVLLLLDHDGDDVCDERRVLFTGFGTGDTHAGPSNFRLGPDGWIWGTVGYSGFQGDVGGEHHEFFQAVFRFKPDGSKLERVASTSNNTWGLGFSSTGEVFASTANGEHLVHVVLPAQALETLPGLPINATTHVEDHTRLHSLLPLRQVDYFGGYTAACNAAICTSRTFPAEYFDRVAFVCEPTGHVVHRCLLEPRGSTFTSHDGWNMLASLDEWTAPVAAECGPDGALWVLDFYTPVVQHNPTPHGFATGKGNAYETPHRDKQHGRIWRIVQETRTIESRVQRMLVGKEFKQRQEYLARHGNFDAPLPPAMNAPWPPVERRLVDASGHPIEPLSDPAAWARRLFDLLSAPADPHDPWPAVAATLAAAEVGRDFLELALAPDPTRDRAAAPPAAPTNLLVNPSLEELEPAAAASTAAAGSAPDAPRAWRPMGWGGRADFGLAERGHTGVRALRITSATGADASWSQVVAVEPDATYKLSGWIRTEKVEPLGAAQGALFNVHELQSPKIVRTPAVTGTHDWTRVEVTFDSGRHDHLTVNALLGGWGPARGAAEFDDVELVLLRALPPKWKAVHAIAASVARRSPDAALALAPKAGAAATDAAVALLEGFAEGWPRPHVARLEGDALARWKALPVELAPPARAALLLLAERAGALAIFPQELAALCTELRATLADAGAEAEARAEAARRLLALAPGDDSIARVAQALTPLTEPELAKSLARALGESGQEGAGAVLLGRVPQLTPQVLPVALESLLRRPSWQRRLLQDVLAGKVDKKLLAPDVLDRLLKSGDGEVARLATEVAARGGRVPDADRQKLLEQWLPIADQPGDAARGAVVFAEQCAKCHTLDGKGGIVGPDLTNIGTRGRRDLLLEILDPNRSVEGTYRAYDVTLKNGDSLSGRLVGESKTAIELLDATAVKHVLSRDDVQELRALSRSLMPEGLEQLGETDLRALLEYLTRAAKTDGR
jgi:putative membrane-bound dehydrogenase-like protein